MSKDLKPGVYVTSPKRFSADIISCACFLHLKKEKLLFLQKAKERWSENLWGIPCGRREKNEDLFVTMARELKEEIGQEICVSHLKYLGKLFIVQKEGTHNIHHVFYYSLEQDIPITLSDEHADYKWVSKEEISSLPLIPFQDVVLLKFMKDLHS